MASDSILGIYWDHQHLYHIITEEKQIVHLSSFPASLEEDDEAVSLAAYTERVSIALKDVIAESSVGTKNFAISIPTKEIIFRTFVIPHMPAQEIKGTIDFEVTKYIPFSLNDITYAYHAIPIVEKDMNRFKIIFIGIRKSILLKYTATVQKTSAKALIIEPASISTIRMLHRKGIVNDEKSAVIVEYEVDSGRIIVLENGIPHFIREFQLMAADMDDNTFEVIDPAQKLMNEIQISLDYFSRQYSNVQMKELILISDKIKDGLIESLSNFLNLSVSAFECQTLLETEHALPLSYLCAAGASIVDEENLPYDFSFLGRRKPIRKKKKKKKKEKKEKSLLSKPVSGVQNISKTIFVAGIIVVGIFIYTNKISSDLEKQLIQLHIELDAFVDMDTKTIETYNDKYTQQLAEFNIEPVRSDIYSVLNALPATLSEGIWFKFVRSEYMLNETKKIREREQADSMPPLKLTIGGYTYASNPNEQFNMVSQFLNNLRNSEVFSELFEEIKLKTTTSQKIEDFDVTYFEVECL